MPSRGWGRLSNEGHGFSRATQLVRLTALEAAEVRFLQPYRAKSPLSAAALAADDCKDVPQGLKPSAVRAACGTAKTRALRFINTTQDSLPLRKQPINKSNLILLIQPSLQGNQQLTSSKSELFR